MALLVLIRLTQVVASASLLEMPPCYGAILVVVRQKVETAASAATTFVPSPIAGETGFVESDFASFGNSGGGMP